MNKQIIPIPQINHITEKLKLSTACEFLYQHILSFEAIFQMDKTFYSYEDMAQMVASSKFLNENYGKKLTTWMDVEKYMAENF